MIKPTPYAYLHMFCCSEAGRNEKVTFGGSKELPNRPKFICDILELHGINYHLDEFKRSDDENSLSYFNIEVSFGQGEDTIMYTAHHDVVQIESENCQDNTASVVNLLDLCFRLKEKKLDRRVVIAFTDGEECGGIGAGRLSQRILDGEFGKVSDVVNSELTALGGSIWMEESGTRSEKLDGVIDSIFSDEVEDGKEDLTVKWCPFNDSVILRQFGINSTCFGILPEDEIEDRIAPTWTLCHRMNDQFHLSDHEDMTNYVDFLESLI